MFLQNYERLHVRNKKPSLDLTFYFKSVIVDDHLRQDIFFNHSLLQNIKIVLKFNLSFLYDKLCKLNNIIIKINNSLIIPTWQ